MTTTLLPDTLSTAGSWARFIAQALDASGIDSRQLFLDAGIDLAEAENPNVRIPVHKMSQAWKLAVQRTGDPCFALTLAARANPSIYNALGMSMIASRTLGEALHRAGRFSQVASEGATVLLQECAEGKAELLMQLSAAQKDVVTAEAMEAFMATATTILRSICRQEVCLAGVYFRHNREPFRETYEAFFQAPLFFDAAEYKIVFEREALEFKCDQANPQLAESIDSWMNEYLAGFAADSLSLRVRRLLTQKLPDGEFRQDEVASALAMSARSLQRGLQKEGVSFRDLLEITRQDLAMKYMQETQLSIIDICCLLGFSDQSNFTKAFKRWTGQTPFSYRQSCGA